MPKKTILVISAASGLGGDGYMFLLGIPYLLRNHYDVIAVTIPNGETTEKLEKMGLKKSIRLSMGSTNAYKGEVNKFYRLISLIYAILRTCFEIFSQSVDYIYSFDRTSSIYVAYISSLITGRKLVVNAHHFHYLGNSKIHKLLLDRAVKISVASDFVRQKFMTYVNPSEKVVRIFNAIDLNNYDPQLTGACVRNELGIADNDPLILLPGRLNPFKGQDTLLHAAPYVLEKYPNTKYIFAGRGDDYLPDLNLLATQLRISEAVFFIGYREDLPALMAASTIVTVPSIEEPFGIVAIEAMAMQKPLIATHSGGIPEFVDDHVDGILVSPQDPCALAKAIIEILDNKDLAIRLGGNGRNKIETHFDKSVYGEKIVKFFNEIN